MAVRQDRNANYGKDERYVIISGALSHDIETLKKAWGQKIREMSGVHKKQEEYKRKILRKYNYDIVVPDMDIDDWKITMSFYAYLFGVTGAKFVLDDDKNRCVNEDSVKLLMELAEKYRKSG